MKYPKPQKYSFLIALIAIFAGAAFAQTPAPTPPPAAENDDTPITVSSRLIVVPVSVTDAAGQPVMGLTAKDFLVSEENRPQTIEKVSDADKVPLEIAILFDVSSSTNAMFQYEQETAAKFLQEVMRPEDRATIFTIGERPLLVQPRGDGGKSAVSIKSIQPASQVTYTAFYDTVRTAAEYLDKNAPSGTRKVIVVISDGEDTNSVGVRNALDEGFKKLGKKIDTLDSKSLYQLTVANRNEASLREQNRVLKSLQNADTVFYSINPGGMSLQLNKMGQFGQSNLDKFATQTGGTAFLPKFQPIGLKDELQNSFNMKRNQEMLSQIFRQLANELRAQYLVQYYSEADFALNRYVNLKVGLTDPRNLKVRAREGYFVKAPDAK